MRLFEGTAWDRPPTCERCGKLEAECTCPPIVAAKELIPPQKQTAQLSVEKRKKGKLVTVIRGLSAEANDLSALLTKLKNSCGAGGAIEEDALEIQGDQLSRLQTILSEIGYRVVAR
ncbi:MAG TPA: translation initiation factor [Schlesneria sp.]